MGVYEEFAETDGENSVKATKKGKSGLSLPNFLGNHAEGLDSSSSSEDTPTVGPVSGGRLAEKFKKKGFFAGKIPVTKSFRPTIDKKHLVVYGLWIALVGTAYHTVSSDAFTRIKNIPLQKENLSIMHKNKTKQEEEIKALESLTLNSAELEQKEKMLDSYIPTQNPKIATQQVNFIQAAAKRSGVDIRSIQRISGDEWKQDSADKQGAALKDFGIENFYNNAWFNKFTLDIDAPEEVIMRFMEEVERDSSMMIDSPGLNRGTDGVKYGLTIKAFYTIKSNTDGNN